ncbi:hypothetical protein TrRE_jg10130, partial [Triparma retinervis]
MSNFQRNVNPSPIVGIRQRISNLRGEREKVMSDIEQLQGEKDEIEDALPVLIDRLVSLHGGIEESREEMGVYDTAIRDMNKTYAMILQPGGIDLMGEGGGKGGRKGGWGEGGRDGEEEEEEENGEYDPEEEERAMKAAETNYMVDML